MPKPPNTPPVTPTPGSGVAPIANGDTLSTNEDTAVHTTASALLGNDSGAGHLHISAVGNASHGTLSFSPSTGAVSDIIFTPDANYNGAAGFDYTLTDSPGHTATGHVTVNVAPVNDAPVVANPIADQSATAGAAFSYPVPGDTFSDVDGDTLSYSSSTHPAWLSFDASTHTFSGTPTSADVTTGAGAAVTLTADDGHGGTVTDTFNIAVAAPPTPTNQPPVANDDVVNAVFSFSNEVGDRTYVIEKADIFANDYDPDGPFNPILVHN